MTTVRGSAPNSALSFYLHSSKSRAADFTIAAGEVCQAALVAERGLEVKLIGAKGITAPAQLRGETLAGDPGDSNYDLHRRKIMRAHGVGESDYAVKIIGTSPFRFEALRRGEVAACMLAPPYDGQALSEGFNLLASGAEYIPHYATTACWARSAWVNAHRDKVLHFVRAFVTGADWVKKRCAWWRPIQRLRAHRR